MISFARSCICADPVHTKTLSPDTMGIRSHCSGRHNTKHASCRGDCVGELRRGTRSRSLGSFFPVLNVIDINNTCAVRRN